MRDMAILLILLDTMLLPMLGDQGSIKRGNRLYTWHLCLSLSWTQIVGVSRTTLYHWRVEYGLVDYARENITNPKLRSVLLHLHQEMPALGERMVWGRLQAMVFIVRQARLRQAIREVDPLHTALCWRGNPTGRRPYSVPGPNPLWHLGKIFLFVCLSTGLSVGKEKIKCILNIQYY